MLSFPRQIMQLQGVRPCGHLLMDGLIPMIATNNLKLDVALYQIKYIIIMHIFSVKTSTQIDLNTTCLKEFININVYINVYIPNLKKNQINLKKSDFLIYFFKS